MKKRTAWRKVGIGIGAMLGVSAIPISYALWWAYTAKAQPTMNYAPAMRSLMASGPPTSVEARQKLNRILLRIDNMTRAELRSGGAKAGNLPSTDFEQLRFGDPRRPEAAMIHEAIASLRADGSIDALRSLAELPPPAFADPAEHGPPPDQVPLMTIAEDVYFYPIRDVSNLCVLMMRLSALDGDPDEVLVWLRAAINIVEGWASVPTVFNGIRSVWMLKRISSEITMLAREELLPDDHVRRAMSIIDERPRFVEISRIVEGERLAVLDLMDHCYAPGPIGGGWFLRSTGPDGMGHPLTPWRPLDAPRVRVDWTGNLWSMTMPTRRDGIGDLERYFDIVRREMALRPAQWSPDPDRYLETARDPTRFIRIYFGLARQRAWKMALATPTMMDGTRLALAIELFRRARHDLPRSLDELVPEFIESLPEDAFARDGVFTYCRLEPGGDALDRCFRLYSLGPNCDDDGGHGWMAARRDDISFDETREALRPAR